jgi:hypothetical protein
MQTKPKFQLHIFTLRIHGLFGEALDENHMACQLPTMDQNAGIESGASIICG